MPKLFVYSPSRKDLYIKLNANSDFPLKFCPTRWTENEDVADWTILIWSSVQSFTKHFLSISQSTSPKNNKSFDTLVQYHSNAFMIVQFDVLKELASKLNVFLVKFQTDSPMIPFLFDVPETLLRSLMKRFALRAKLEEVNTPYQLIKLDLDCQGSLLPIDQLWITIFSIYQLNMPSDFASASIIKFNCYSAVAWGITEYKYCLIQTFTW